MTILGVWMDDVDRVCLEVSCVALKSEKGQKDFGVVLLSYKLCDVIMMKSEA